MGVREASKQYVVSKIDQNKLLNQLKDLMGVTEFFEKSPMFPRASYWSQEKTPENKKELCLYEDTSMHGSSDFECIKVCDDPVIIKRYEAVEKIIDCLTEG